MGFTVVLCLLIPCKASHSHDGTYEGVLPAADCPGFYIMLSIDGDKYELMEKYIQHSEIYLTYGELKTMRHGECLALDNNMEVEFRDNGVWCRNTLLQPCSDKKEIPKIYVTQLLKEYQSGEEASLKLYEKKGKRYADFCFNAKKYTLMLDTENMQMNEYVSGNNSLIMLPNTDKELLPGSVLFSDGAETYTFALLTPVNCIYSLVGTAPSGVPSFLDVMYYNDGEQAFVKLIHIASRDLYTLPQTEASAKTAVYTNGIVEWQMGNQQNGTLIIQNQKFMYKEVY